VVRKLKPPKELLDKWAREDEEARRIRRESADWEFIEKQEPKIKLALIVYLETGDIYKASKIAEMTIDEFNELRIKAKLPSIT